MKLIGFFAFIYGWFSLDTYGFTIEGIVTFALGFVLLGGLEVLSKFEWRKNDNQ